MIPEINQIYGSWWKRTVTVDFLGNECKFRTGCWWVYFTLIAYFKMFGPCTRACRKKVIWLLSPWRKILQSNNECQINSIIDCITFLKLKLFLLRIQPNFIIHWLHKQIKYKHCFHLHICHWFWLQTYFLRPNPTMQFLRSAVKRKCKPPDWFNSMAQYTRPRNFYEDMAHNCARWHSHSPPQVWHYSYQATVVIRWTVCWIHPNG